MIFVHDTPTNRLLNMVLSGGSPVAEYTATGNPLTFTTDLAKPLKSLLIPFTPQQEGTGDPSPSNVRDIVPWNGLKVWNGGKNLLPNTASSKTVNGVTFTVNSDGTISVSGTATGYADLTIGKSEVPNKGKIVLSGLEETVKVRWSQIRILDANNNVLGDFYGQATTRPYVINMDDYPTAKYVQIGIKREDNNVPVSGTVKPMIEIGETATAYEPYSPITETDISFPSPVYGGVLDAVTGELWATYSYVEKKWSDGNVPTVLGEYTRKQFNMGREPMTAQASKATERFCNVAPWLVQYTDQSSHYYFYQSGEGEVCIGFVFLPSDTDSNTKIQLAVALKNPVFVATLTPQQITALVGNNTIWSDADGSMTAVYLKKG